MSELWLLVTYGLVAVLVGVNAGAYIYGGADEGPKAVAIALCLFGAYSIVSGLVTIALQLRRRR